VLAAITKVLEINVGPMQASTIHAAVEELLGDPVAWSSVKNGLTSNISGQSPRFERVGRGRYQVRPENSA
jgi:hypothetical protein